MVKDNEPATVPSSAFYVDSASPTDIEQGLQNGSMQGAGAAEHRKDKAELLSVVVSKTGADVQLMEPVPKDKQLTLEFPNISAWVPDLFGPNSAAAEGDIIRKTFRKLTKRRSTREAKPSNRQVISSNFVVSMCICRSGTSQLSRLAAGPVGCIFLAPCRASRHADTLSYVLP